MFSSLSKGSVLYGVDRKGDMNWFTGSIERISPSVNQNFQPSFNQFPTVAIDIVANINGEQKTFQQVPSNDVVADFGEDALIIADNKDSLCNYVKSLLQKSEDAVRSAPTHEARIPKYKRILSELMPGINNSEEVKALREEVGTLKSQLSEAISLLKEKAKQTN